MAVRFGTTLAANLVRIGLSFLSGVLIARQLGAAAYGDLYFLIGSFAAISQLMDAGTSTAFYTFISQRRRSSVFFAFYFAWTLLQFLVPFGTISMLLPATVVDRVWIGHDRWIVLAALGASFLTNQIWGAVSHLGEALRRTVVLQLVATIQAAAHLVLIAAGAYGGWLTAKAVLLLLIVEYAVICSLVGPWLARESLSARGPERGELGRIVREFAAYCQPLVISTSIGFLYAFADRWLLQRFGGSVEQGFFAVGQQFAAISSLATTSMIWVFWKEIAEAHAQADTERTRRLYRDVSRALYFGGAWISCLAIPYSREILVWTVGAAFESGFLVLALMILYQVHQTLGRIQGAFCYATGNPQTIARIGVLMMVVSIPVTYLVLAAPPVLSIGLGLGAAGLALKMVLLQFGAVTLQEFLIARRHGWDHDYRYQAGVLGGLLGAAWSCKFVASQLVGGIFSGGNQIGTVITGVSLYLIASFLLVSRAPGMIAITKGLPSTWLRRLVSTRSAVTARSK